MVPEEKKTIKEKVVDKILDAVRPQPKHKWALVLEGGLMRSVFTAGVLDAIHENCHDKFDLVIGVSAGAACGINFVADQRGRMYNIFLNYLSNKSLNEFARFYQGKRKILALGKAIREISKTLVPLNVEALAKTSTELKVGLTSVKDGLPKYVDVTTHNCIDALVATCSIPLLTREPAEFQGVQYVDGGVSDPIPLLKAMEFDADRIVVIMSRPVGFRQMPGTLISKLLSRVFRKHNEVESLIKYEHNLYNKTKNFVETFENPDVELITVAPPDDFKVEMLTRNTNTLNEGYAMGFIAGIGLEKKLIGNMLVKSKSQSGKKTFSKTATHIMERIKRKT